MAIATYRKAATGTRKTKQSEPIPGENQVQNNAGGFVFELDQWKFFERFLILGTEGGSFYTTESKLTADNAKNAIKCIMADGKRAVDMIVQISDSGRAAKNDPAIFALAMAASIAKDADTRAYALSKVGKVCRIPTHLFHFVAFLKDMRGFGPAVRKAIGGWFNDMPVGKLGYEVAKYQKRDGWAGADVLRQAHPVIKSPEHNAVYRWMLGKDLGAMDVTRNKVTKHYAALNVALPPHIVGLDLAKQATTAKKIVKLVNTYKLTREMLPTEALTYPEVWQALLDAEMPLTALIRNLGNLSKHGLLGPNSDNQKLVRERLADVAAIKKARLHPLTILMALKTYGQGRGMLGSSTWAVNQKIVDALDDAFYASFGTIDKTGKRLLFGLDVSGSMSSPFRVAMADGKMAQSVIRSCEVGAVLAMVQARVEDSCEVFGFASSFVDLGISPKQRLDDVCKRVLKNNFGGTDCAVPMIYAEKQKIPVDCFVVVTDNETWAGNVHPKQALESYRRKMGIDAKQAVIGTDPTPFTIADPNDPRTIDFVGFDTAVPQALAEFIR